MFDRESRDSYQLSVICSDLGSPSLSSQVVVRVKITDDNDVTPTFDRELYSASVSENNRVGATILQVYDSKPKKT